MYDQPINQLTDQGWYYRCVCIQYKHTILFCRVDAKVATDEKEETPLKIALERDNTEIVVLLCEAIGEEVPDKVKIEQ